MQRAANIFYQIVRAVISQKFQSSVEKNTFNTNIQKNIKQVIQNIHRIKTTTNLSKLVTTVIERECRVKGQEDQPRFF